MPHQVTSTREHPRRRPPGRQRLRPLPGQLPHGVPAHGGDAGIPAPREDQEYDVAARALRPGLPGFPHRTCGSRVPWDRLALLADQRHFRCLRSLHSARSHERGTSSGSRPSRMEPASRKLPRRAGGSVAEDGAGRRPAGHGPAEACGWRRILDVLRQQLSTTTADACGSRKVDADEFGRRLLRALPCSQRFAHADEERGRLTHASAVPLFAACPNWQARCLTNSARRCSSTSTEPGASDEDLEPAAERLVGRRWRHPLAEPPSHSGSHSLWVGKFISGKSKQTPSSRWSSRRREATCCGAAQHGPQAERTSLTSASQGWSGS